MLPKRPEFGLLLFPCFKQLEKSLLALMFSVACRKANAVRSAVKGASSLVGKCFFAEAAKPIEFDIIENMKTYPLFGEKVKVDALSSRHD